MASTNKTPQLGLNQWAAGDEVMRTDFNADNAKIDATVETLRNENCMVKLIDITTTTASAQYDLDVSGIVWSKYTEVIIYASLNCSGSGELEKGYLRVNGFAGSGDYVSSNSPSPPYSASYCCNCNFQPKYGRTRNRYAIITLEDSYTICGEYADQCYWANDSGYCSRVSGLAAIRTFNFVPHKADIQVLPGSRIVVYGVQ